MTTHDLSRLFQDCVAGVETACHDLLVYLGKFARDVLFRKLGSYDQVDDLAQTAIIRFNDAKERLQFKSSNKIKGYVAKICFNLVHGLRSPKKKIPFVQRDNIEELPNVSYKEDNIEFVRFLQKALIQLPPKDRQLVKLKYEEDLSYAEIAKEMDRDIDFVRVGLGRIKRNLKKIIIKELPIE